jgi:hypothetical protein
VAQIAVPAVIVWAALPGLGFGLVVLGGIACEILLAVLYSLAYINQSAQRRLVKRGGEPETVKVTLYERYEREHADQIARYIQTYRDAA